MRREIFHIAPAFQPAVQRSGLTTAAAIRAAQGEFIKNHLGLRDVVRLTIDGDDGAPLTLFLKRNLKPILKHSWHAILRHGRFVSSAELEWRNFNRLARAGVTTCEPVACGATFGPIGETFSFVMTAAAPGVEMDRLARDEHDWRKRRQISRAVAQMLRRSHDAGIGLPTLFGRHVFIDQREAGMVVTLIDVDRLARPPIMTLRRTRDLAQLHLSIPSSYASERERLRFLRAYAGTLDRRELARIRRRMRYLERKKPNLAKTYRSG